jgi:hypothetical protein
MGPEQPTGLKHPSRRADGVGMRRLSIRRASPGSAASAPSTEGPAARPRRLDSRGTALVEGAIVTPILLLAMFMVIDTGLLMFTKLTTGEVVGEVSREAIVLRDFEDADSRILDALELRMTGLNRSQLERLVIYQAGDMDADPPTACTTGALASSTEHGCSVYGPDDLDKTWGELVCGWCPENREDGHLIGIWVRLKFNSATGLLPEVSMTERQVRPIELDL